MLNNASGSGRRMRSSSTLAVTAAFLVSACGPSEKSETEQRIVDVYESWSADVRPASCPRYYGFPNCPDLNNYKGEIDDHCGSLSKTTDTDLNDMMNHGWRIQSHDNHDAESDVKMSDGLVLDITCKGQRYIVVRTCVTKTNWLGQETRDPKCNPPAKGTPAQISSPADSTGSDNLSEGDEPLNAIDMMSNAADALEMPAKPSTPMTQKTVAGLWRIEGECGGFATYTLEPNGVMSAEGLEGRWSLNGDQLAWRYRSFDLGEDPKSVPLKIDTGTVNSVSDKEMEVAWNKDNGVTTTYYRCPSN